MDCKLTLCFLHILMNEELNIIVFFFCSIVNIIACVLSAVIIAVNMYFVGDYVSTSFPHTWFMYLSMSIFGILYLTFCVYLVMHVMISMGCSRFDGYHVCFPLNYYYYYILMILFIPQHFMNIIFVRDAVF